MVCYIDITLDDIAVRISHCCYKMTLVLKITLLLYRIPSCYDNNAITISQYCYIAIRMVLRDSRPAVHHLEASQAHKPVFHVFCFFSEAFLSIFTFMAEIPST